MDLKRVLLSDLYPTRYFQKNTKLGKDNHVIISIPHEYCSVNESIHRHLCDKAAPYVAAVIERKLDRCDNIKTKTFNGTVYRRRCDLNRKESRVYSCGFRPEMTNYTKKLLMNPKSNVFCIDIHSYPKKYKKWSENLDLYILDDDPAIKPYTKLFVKYMKEHGVKCSAVPGKIGENDIMVEMRSMGVDCFLIEFNEQILVKNAAEFNSIMNTSQSRIVGEIKERIDYVCNKVVDWISTINF